MSPVVLDVRNAEDQRDIVHRAVQALAEGKLVLLPTETVYVLMASALQEPAVARLLAAKDSVSPQGLTLAVKSADDALDYVPNLSPVALRLARRCWPGPVTLVFDDDHPDSLAQQLPAAVRAAVLRLGTIGLRVPAHPLTLAILRLCAGPLALIGARRADQEEAVTAQEAIQLLGDRVDLVVDDGRSKFAQRSSVIHVAKSSVRLIREGVIGPPTVKRLASFMVLLVCTGNTCRSPMAEMLLKRRLAARLHTTVNQLEDQGAMVLSAGISAVVGSHASPEAVQVMSARELDLSHHESQPLTDRLVRFADVILAMTRGHRDAIVRQWPEAANRTRLLAGDHNDVSDPIGGPIELYRACADQIDRYLERWLAELDLEQLISQTEAGG